MEAITEAAIKLCIPLSPERYHVPEVAADDPRFMYHGEIGADNADDRIFTSQTILDNEAFIADLTERPTTNSLTDADAKAVLDAWQRHRPHDSLSPDQYAAALHIVTKPASMTALVGPAGTGKTRTMKAVKHAWETTHGPGTVIGVGPSARAARELGNVGIHAMTIDRLLVENTPAAQEGRHAWRAILNTRLANARNPVQRALILRQIAKAITVENNITLRPNTLLIVDEASMASTHHIAALGRLAEKVGAKITLVGDPEQLGAIGAGGVLGWLARQNKTVELNELHRFKNEWERQASLRLRRGDATVLFPAAEATKSVDAIYYAIRRDRPEQFGHDHDRIMAEAIKLHRDGGQPGYGDYGRIHDGDETEMMEYAYQAVREAQKTFITENGKTRLQTAVLIAASNENVFELNQRATTERRALGEVDNSITVPLREGADAGIGDIISARKNKSKIRDINGVPIENGNLLTVTRINYAVNGKDVESVTATRYGNPEASITIPAYYLRRHCDLGYAITAHRAQGLTVDVAHLFVPWGARLSRKLLYVAMTRGQYENHADVATPTADDLNHEHKPAFRREKTGEIIENRPTGAETLATMVKPGADDLTAHEYREQEAAKVATLAHLLAEHDYVAGHVTGPWLHQYLTDVHGTEIADNIYQSQHWDKLVTAFRRAYFIAEATAAEDGGNRALKLIRCLLPESRVNFQDSFDDIGEELAVHLRTLESAVVKARWQVERLGQPDAHPKAIAAAQKAASEAKVALTVGEVTWRAAHPGKDLPAGNGNNVPADLRRLRYAAADTEAVLAATRDPASHSNNLSDAAQTLQAAEEALREALPDHCAILHRRLTDGVILPAASKIDDPRFIGGKIVPLTTKDAAAAAVAAQTEPQVSTRFANIIEAVTSGPLPEWAAGLPPKPDPDDERFDKWVQVASAAAIYRDAWGVTSESLLGTEPANNQLQAAEYRGISDLLTYYHFPDLRPPAPARPEPDPREHPDYDWEADPAWPGTLETTAIILNAEEVEDFADGSSLPLNELNEQLTAIRQGDAAVFDIETRPDPSWKPSGSQGEEPDPEFDEDELWAPLLADAAATPTWQTKTTEPKPADEEYLNHLAAINQTAYTYWQNVAATSKSWVPDYLAERGLDNGVAAHCPDTWRATTYHLRRAGYADQDIINAGLAIQPPSGGHIYDRFRDRIPFPIYDQAGRIAGFTARAKPGSEDETKWKYINTPKTDLYIKGQALYGLDEDAKTRLADGATPILVEGPFDAAAITAAAKQTGENLVPLATCGTAVTADQLQLIADHRENGLANLIVGLDNDTAGIKAAARIFTIIGPRDAGQIKTTAWGGYKDPGEFAANRAYETLTWHLTDEYAQTPLTATWARHQLAETSNPDQAFAHSLLAAAVVTSDDTAIKAVSAVLTENGYTDLDTATERLKTLYDTGWNWQPTYTADQQADDQAWLDGATTNLPDASGGDDLSL
jgi:DNA primase catalytic core